MANKLVMSWSQCKVLVGKTQIDASTGSEGEPTEWFELGYIKDKTTTLTAEDGDVLEAVATGGRKVAREQLEYTYNVAFTIMEMDYEIYAKLTGNKISDDKSNVTVVSNLINDDYALKIVPHNIGGNGIKALRGRLAIKESQSEEEGNYHECSYEILAQTNGTFYEKFKVTASDWTA